MHTCAPATSGTHTRFRITTEHPTQFVDITGEVEAFVTAAGAARVLLPARRRRDAHGQRRAGRARERTLALPGIRAAALRSARNASTIS